MQTSSFNGVLCVILFIFISLVRRVYWRINMTTWL